MKTLVMGMGNVIVSDDGVGIKVAQLLKNKVEGYRDVTVIECIVSGLGLVDIITGYDKVIIIDSIQTKDGTPGSIYRIAPDDVEVFNRSPLLHDASILSILDLGRALQLEMPQEVIIFAIEAEDMVTFSEKCTPKVEEAIPVAAKRVIEEIEKSVPTDTLF